MTCCKIPKKIELCNSIVLHVPCLLLQFIYRKVEPQVLSRCHGRGTDGRSAIPKPCNARRPVISPHIFHRFQQE
ncbi:hypothetical protein J6590_042838 [Homalodisca vitripennis]|nr:hypothetical protein J6590_042838 [Homalodisca vitripennis]